MTPLQRLAEAVLSDPARARELAEKITARHDRDKKAKAARSRLKPEIEAVSRAKGREKQAETMTAKCYDAAKRKAAARAYDPECSFTRCEYVSVLVGDRCPAEAIDPDHVVGGAYRAECERLGAEGLEMLCRGHHDLKHRNLPSRRFWLDHQSDHAERHDYRRLAALVAKARARHEAKHPGAPGTKEGETP